MTNQRHIPIALPSTGREEWLALREPLMTGWLSQGAKVAEFEKFFAKRHHVKHAIATTSCTTALHLILAGLGVGPGDEVIVPSFTWVATANVVLHCGATPVFVDVDPETYNIDVTQVEKKLSKRTKAIIAVHLFGLCADMDALALQAPGIPIIEDAACASGSEYKGRSAGSLGIAAAFSFHARKSITTGEGGMITTNHGKLAEKLRTLRNHGAGIAPEERHHGAQPYIFPKFDLLGFNYRMTDLQGAVGLVQLRKLDRFMEEREAWANFYHEELSRVGWLKTPKTPPRYKHAWQSYVCRIDEKKALFPRDAIMKALQSKGISTRPGTHAVHTLGYYKKVFDLKAKDFPVSWDLHRFSMAIPLHNRMTARDYRYVVQTIKRIAF